MADKEKRSLREFLRHINDYTYRFNPEKGQFRYRELRGVRDTAFDFYMWLKCWKDMIVFVAKCPVSAVRALFRYQWFSTYLTYPNFVDRGTLGMRGNQLRMARAQYDRIVKKATDLLRKEWGYRGLVMTDWVIAGMTADGKKYPMACASGTIRAGNDLMMPGSPADQNDLLTALRDPAVRYPLTRANLERCGARIVETARRLAAAHAPKAAPVVAED